MDILSREVVDIMSQEIYSFLVFVLVIFLLYLFRGNKSAEVNKYDTPHSEEKSKDRIQTNVITPESFKDEILNSEKIKELYEQLVVIRQRYIRFSNDRNMNIQRLIDEFNPGFIINPDESLEIAVEDEHFTKIRPNEFIVLLEAEIKKHLEFDSKLVRYYISNKPKLSSYERAMQGKNTDFNQGRIYEDKKVARSYTSNSRSNKFSYLNNKNFTSKYYINKYGMVTKNKDLDDSD